LDAQKKERRIWLYDGTNYFGNDDFYIIEAYLNPVKKDRADATKHLKTTGEG